MSSQIKVVYPATDTGTAWTLVGGGASMAASLDEAYDGSRDTQYINHDTAPTLRLILEEGQLAVAIPTTATIVSVEVFIEHSELTGGLNTCAAVLNVGGTEYAHGTPVSSPTAPEWLMSQFVWALNPATGAAWTRAAAVGITTVGANWTGAHRRVCGRLYVVVRWNPVAAPERPTWDTALADPSIPIRWLLEMSPDGGTTVLRFAEGALDIDGTFFAGALKLNNNPTLDYDPFTGNVSVGRVSVTLLPLPDDAGSSTPIYPKDLAEVHGVAWQGWSVTLYRWAEGSAFADVDPIIDGRIRGVKFGANKALAFTLVDKSILWDIKLPRCFFDARHAEYAQMDEDEAGFGFPLLYGPVQCRCVRKWIDDVTSDYVCIAQGKMDNIVYIYADDVLQTVAAITQYADPVHGVPTTQAEIATLGDGVVYAVGGGQVDDASGTVTGTADAYLEHILHQLHHLMIDPCGIPNSEIDTASVGALVTALGAFNGAIRVECNDSTSLMQVIKDVGLLTRSFLGIERCKFRMTLFDIAAGATEVLLDGVNVRAVQEVGWTRDENLATKLTLKYNWLWGGLDQTWEYRSLVEYTSDDDGLLADNLTLLGMPQEIAPIETKHLAGEAAGIKAAALIATVYHKQRRVIKLVCDRTTHNYRMCERVNITTPVGDSDDGNGWVGLAGIVVGIEYGLETNTFTLWEM